jgi:aryl sulfotransferase
MLLNGDQQEQPPKLVRPALREYRTWTSDSRRWQGYEPRAGDIVIASAPKCGTTWMQQIIASLVFQDATPRALPRISPWIEARFFDSEAAMYAALAKQTHRRFLKTHLPIDGLPIYDSVRYVHVARDGRDAVMSMHNHFTSFTKEKLATFDKIGLGDPMVAARYPRFPADPAAYFRQWLTTPAIAGQTDGTPYPSYFHLEAGYWSERERPNLLLVHYNDLHADLDTEMRRIAAFLAIEIDEAIWPSLVKAAGFAEMQANGAALMPHLTNTLVGAAGRFFHKGCNGRWRTTLHPDDLTLYETKVRSLLPAELANWLVGGRAKGAAMQPSPAPPEVIHNHAGEIRVLVSSSDTGGAMSIIETTIEPGRGPTWHNHSREDEVFYVVSGIAEVRIGNDVYRCEPGSRVFGPRNVFHTYRNAGDTILKMIIAYTPAGFEQSFTETAALVAQGKDHGQIAEMLAERYGLTREPMPDW